MTVFVDDELFGLVVPGLVFGAVFAGAVVLGEVLPPAGGFVVPPPPPDGGGVVVPPPPPDGGGVGVVSV